MSGAKFTPTIDEIELVCGYIKDDQTIANYFGIARDRVTEIRDQMRQTIPYRPYLNEARSGLGLNSHLIAADEAEVGSRKLNERLHELFRKWERIHGFQEGAAKILLPAGYVPDREAA